MTVTGENGADASACTPSLSSGSKGTKTVTFDLTEAATPRTYTVKVTTSGTIPGIGVATDVSATIKIEQTDSYVPTTDALYSENCGTTVEKDGTYWPYADAFMGWTRGGTLDQEGVTYGGNKASVRNSGKDYDPTDDEKAEVSGYPYAYINGSQGLDISNINVGSNTNFTFTFTALNTTETLSESPYTPTFGDVTASTLKFSVNPDGTAWMPVEITTKKLGTGSWYLCTAMFKLPAGVSTDKISVRFDSYSGGASLRLDDFKLYEGGDGTELAPEVPTQGTISQVTESGATYTIEGATVVGTYKQGFVMQDNTGAILVYMGYDADASKIPAEGSTVSVSGKASMYGGALQLAEPTIISTVAGTMPTLTPTEVTADNIAGMMTAPKVTYVKMTGTLSAGNYVNVEFLFKSDYTGTISAPNDDLNVSSLNGKVVDVEGWFVNNGSSNNGTYFTVVARKVTENASVASGSFTKQPETFAATDPQAQTLTYEANAAAGNVTFDITGADADKFSVTPKTGSVEVSAKGDNTGEVAYTATLVMKAADGTVLAQVTLKQNGTSSGTDTKGTYESMTGMVPTSTDGDNAAYAEKANINGGSEVAILKLGTGKKNGVFTTSALGVSGNKKLSFYAAAWNGKKATIYVRVNNGGSVSPASIEPKSNSGVASTAPYTITFDDNTDYYTFELTDLTENSTLTFSTSANFDASSNSSSGRALLAGIQIY